MRDIINKEEIQEIVVKTFYDLGYKEKYSREYYIDLVTNVFKQINWDDLLVKTEDTDDSVDENEDSVIDEEKTYGHKPHLASLPHDRRTSDISELCERFDVCTQKMLEHQKNIANLTEEIYNDMKTAEANKLALKDSLDKMGQMALDNQAFYDVDDKVIQEKSDWLDRAIREVNTESEFKDLPKDIMDDLGDLRKIYFKKDTTSWVTEEDANDFYDVANRIVDYAYSVTGGDDTEWSNRVTGLADDIRVLASNDFFNKDLPSLHEKSHGLIELTTALDVTNQLQNTVNAQYDALEKKGKDLDNEKRLYEDYHQESLNTAQRTRDLGFLDE